MADPVKLRQLTEQYQAHRRERIDELTRRCLHTPKPGCSAQPNGPPISPLKYAVVRVAQSLVSGGAIDALTRLRAENTAGELEMLLARMFDGASGGSLQAEAVMAAWGAALARFNKPGNNVSEFIRDAVAACCRKAEAAVAAEERDPSTPLGVEFGQLSRA